MKYPWWLHPGWAQPFNYLKYRLNRDDYFESDKEVARLDANAEQHRYDAERAEKEYRGQTRPAPTGSLARVVRPATERILNRPRLDGRYPRPIISKSPWQGDSEHVYTIRNAGNGNIEYVEPNTDSPTDLPFTWRDVEVADDISNDLMYFTVRRRGIYATIQLERWKIFSNGENVMREYILDELNEKYVEYVEKNRVI